MNPKRHAWTLDMTRRVRFTGRLLMLSALHVGGRTSSLTDAGVVRHSDGRPFIPGSSLKGALRSHLERLAQAPAFAEQPVSSCGLYDAEGKPGADAACPTPGWIGSGSDATSATEEDFERLCHTCTLFGSPILAGKVRVPDLEIVTGTYAGQVEVRDGVGIDRDRGTAVDGILFDYEVVPSGTAFRFELSVDSPDAVELGLAAAAVRELQQGRIAVGGKTTRGLGACRLEGLAVQDDRFDELGGLKQYLLGRAGEAAAKAQVEDPEAFLREHIEALFA